MCVKLGVCRVNATWLFAVGLWRPIGFALGTNIWMRTGASGAAADISLDQIFQPLLLIPGQLHCGWGVGGCCFREFRPFARRRETDGFICSRPRSKAAPRPRVGPLRLQMTSAGGESCLVACQGGKVIAFGPSTERRTSKAGNNKGSQANWI